MSDTRDDIVLRAEGITRVFSLGKTQVRALRGVDLLVRRGEMLAVMGASGSDLRQWEEAA